MFHPHDQQPALNSAEASVTGNQGKNVIAFGYHPMNKELLMEDCMCEPCEAGGSYDVNMEPDDIEVSDTVTVIWELG